MLEESNAIGTAYLRSRLLPEPTGNEVAELLRSYVGARLDFYRAVNDNDPLREISNRTKQLQDQLWSQLIIAVGKDDREVTTGYFMKALNDVIDLDSARLAVRE